MSDHDSDEIQLEDVLTLIDENGNSQDYQLVGDFDFERQSYAVLSDLISPSDNIPENANLMLLKIINEDGEDVLYEIEDDKEWERVVDYWNSLSDD